jgi:hypothetical protein
MKVYVLFTIIILASGGRAQDKVKRLGEIEFFGAAGVDLNKLRTALPFHEGDEFNIEQTGEKKRQGSEAVRQATGHLPTDIDPTCCDGHGNWIIYVGLSGKRTRYNPQPNGATRLPKNILNLYERVMNALLDAAQKGAASEDWSRGYALSEYPPLRSTELEMRTYAVAHEALLRRVVETSADNQQRNRCRTADRTHANQDSDHNFPTRRDSDDTGEHATTRYLFTVCGNPNLARRIPVEGFIELLLSGTWTDLNKAGSLLSLITMGRNPTLLARLRRAEVQERLIEMARWRTGHADAARYILGRMAGIDEERLHQLVSSGNVEEILATRPAR